MYQKSLTTILISSSLIALVASHGMMLEPIGRASRWRFDKSAPKNYDDDGLYCGGFGVQWDKNDGKCGICGDDYSLPTPRPHELGGRFGKGGIVKNYKSDDDIPIGVMLTTSHRGYFEWDICNLDDEKDESDECFEKNKIQLANGKDKFKIHTNNEKGWYNATIKLPNGLKCNHCVLRWTYVAGNQWGFCGDKKNGKGALGCGPQEHFRSCADISIKS